MLDLSQMDTACWILVSDPTTDTSGCLHRTTQELYCNGFWLTTATVDALRSSYSLFNWNKLHLNCEKTSKNYKATPVLFDKSIWLRDNSLKIVNVIIRTWKIIDWAKRGLSARPIVQNFACPSFFLTVYITITAKRLDS